MNETKTFPLIMTKDFHEQIKSSAYDSHESIKNFIVQAIIEKIKKGDKK